MQAEIEVQRIGRQFQPQEVQAKIIMVNAQAAANAEIAAAREDAQAIALRGKAEAIKARGDALKRNSDFVALTAAERWDGKMPAIMIPGVGRPFPRRDVRCPMIALVTKPNGCFARYLCTTDVSRDEIAGSLGRAEGPMPGWGAMLPMYATAGVPDETRVPPSRCASQLRCYLS